MKILPFPEKPILLSYHNLAYPFGIIQANAPQEITKWACTKCVSCSYYPNSKNNKFNILTTDLWGTEEKLTVKQTLYIRKDLVDVFGLNLSYILKESLDNNCYVHGNINEKYVCHTNAYHNFDYTHDFLIIGYNDDNFILEGYTENGVFERFESSQAEVILGLMTIKGELINLDFISYNDNAEPEPNIKRMIKNLKDYISEIEYLPNEASLGISTLIRVRDYFINEITNSDYAYVDRRYARVLLEHEWILNQICDLFLPENQEICLFAKTNYKRAENIHLLGIKMELTQNKKHFENIDNTIKEIIANEIEYIPKLIQCLQEKYTL